jgi:hypothetical protein
MLERNVRVIVAGALLGSHLVTLISLPFLTNLGGLSPLQAKAIIPVTVPLFTAYATAIIKFVVSSRKAVRQSRRRFSKGFSWLSIAVTTILAALIPGMLYLKAFNVMGRFEDFQFWFLSVETMLAAYVGLLIEPLYGSVPTKLVDGSASLARPPGDAPTTPH